MSALPGVRAVLRGAARVPATLAYLAVLGASCWWLAHADPDGQALALHRASSNVANLADGHWWVLLTSAGLVVPPVLDDLVGGGVLLACAELGVGTGSAALAFASGHLGASLVVAGLLVAGALPGVDSESARTAVDVGLSYGTLAAVGAWSTARPRWSAVLCGAALLATSALPLVLSGPTFTRWGHLLSAAIGVAVGGALPSSARVVR